MSLALIRKTGYARLKETHFNSNDTINVQLMTIDIDSILESGNIMVFLSNCRKLHCIAAMDINRGIGKNGDLPWFLPKELKTFARLTTGVKSEGKQNAVIMGRLTYFSIPEKVRPLKNRLNIVLSSTLKESDLPENVLLLRDLESVVEKLSTELYRDTIESAFVIGGSSVYNETMKSSFCQRIYLTEVASSFNCDTFFPDFDKDVFKEINLDEVNHGEQEENDIKYQIHVYSSGEM